MKTIDLVDDSWRKYCHAGPKWKGMYDEWREYSRTQQHKYNPKLNAISREAYKLAGGYNIYKKKTREKMTIIYYKRMEKQIQQILLAILDIIF